MSDHEDDARDERSTQRPRANSLSGQEIWRWNKHPQGTSPTCSSTAQLRSVLIVTKQDERLTAKTKLVAEYLLDRSSSLQLYIEDNFLPRSANMQELFSRFAGRVKCWQPADAQPVDLIITLGGDGTVLHAAWLFQQGCPPILPFHLGSLGFLTVFSFCHYKSLLDRAVLNNIESDGSAAPSSPNEEQSLEATLRMRFTCSVYRADTIAKASVDGQLPPRADEKFQILNDLVVDRGPSPYICNLEVFGDGHHLTTVLADGLVVATPTGSTAYSLSAGGSLVHPDVPAMLLTPICAHTLSFRPMVLPQTMELKIVIPQTGGRSGGAWASFDGRHRIALERGDAIVVTSSPYGVPTICRSDQTVDWFHSLMRCLRWNERGGGREKNFIWGKGVIESPGCMEETDDTGNYL